MYLDSEGIPTGGVGRNLRDVPFSNDEIDLMKSNDMARVVATLDKNTPWWVNLADARKEVMADMTFNMGWGNGTNGLSGFKNALAKIEGGDYNSAANNMMLSKWYYQTGERAITLVRYMRTGEYT